MPSEKFVLYSVGNWENDLDSDSRDCFEIVNTVGIETSWKYEMGHMKNDDELDIVSADRE